MVFQNMATFIICSLLCIIYDVILATFRTFIYIFQKCAASV